MHARAIEFQAPERIGFVEFELPDLGPDQVLVRTLYSGISSGTELLAYRGLIDPAEPLDEAQEGLGGTFSYPFRYGYSCVGRVEQSRSIVRQATLVFAFHPHQDFLVVQAESIFEVSELDVRLATLYPFVETAVQISLDVGPSPGSRVAVAGLGAVGLITCLLLARADVKILGIETVGWKRELAGELGIHAVTPEEASTYGSFPTAVDCSGDPSALQTLIPMLAHEGELTIASWYGDAPVRVPLGTHFHRRRITIRSSQVSTIPARLAPRWDTEKRRRRTLQVMLDLPLKALATHEFPFESAPDAYHLIAHPPEGLVHAALRYEE
jgi:2-desacetyl-2-hydroxyethyl bacteriochlorophyllide A dehydrogenase